MVCTLSELHSMFLMLKREISYGHIAHSIRSESPHSSTSLTCEASAPRGLSQGHCESCSPVAQQDCQHHRRCEDALEDMGSVYSLLIPLVVSSLINLLNFQASYPFSNGSSLSSAPLHPPVVFSRSNAPKAGACSSTTQWSTCTTSSLTTSSLPLSPFLSLSYSTLVPQRTITPPRPPSPPHRKPSPSTPTQTPILLLPRSSIHQNRRL